MNRPWTVHNPDSEAYRDKLVQYSAACSGRKVIKFDTSLLYGEEFHSGFWIV
jgi:hypothetical protein